MAKPSSEHPYRAGAEVNEEVIVTTGNAQQYAAWCVTSTLPPRTSVVPR